MWAFGYEVSKNNIHEHATQLDKSNNNSKCKDVIKDELDQQMEYENCKDLGHKHKAKTPSDF